MIEAIRTTRAPRVRVRCDGCRRDEVLACDYVKQPGGARIPNEGHANRKMIRLGWQIVKGKHLCPRCKPHKGEAPEIEGDAKMDDVKSAAGLRQPSREQKRQIVDLLGAVYDIERERYRDGETDVTVADAIGGGVLFGWVAEIREQLFGPDNGNEAMDRLEAELRDWLQEAQKVSAAAAAALARLDATRSKGAGFAKQLEAIRQSLGPKAKGR